MPISKFYDDVPNLDAIKPQEKGKSDRFSWNLYRFLKKNPRYARVFKGVWNNCTGHDPKNPVLYIGFKDNDGVFMGATLNQIVCTHGRERFPTMCYMMVEHHVDDWEDVTESFYQDYIEQGACLFSDHYHQWEGEKVERTAENEGATRTCIYCGKTEVLVAKPSVSYLWRDQAKSKGKKKS